jgi:hypothetical protein
MKGAFLGTLIAGMAANAHATGRLADVQVIDRETGSVLPLYRSHGEYWVAGRPGVRYSIVIQNHRGERLLAVAAVDGVNVISGETGAWGQSGYVFDPGERYEISGWRKSNTEIADFNFTSAGNSYAARTGRPANIGIIGVALFLERPAPPPRIDYYDPLARNPNSAKDEAAVDAARAAPAAPPLASNTPNGAGSAYASAQAQRSAAPAEKLGTGHGSREYSYVQNTTFDRQSSTPNEVIKIRYDSYENLVAMGVVASRPAWQPANPFPDSVLPKYVPDPPGG